MENQDTPKPYAISGVYLLIASFGFIAVTVLWCWLLGHGRFERSSIAFALCTASFGVGSVGGFMFTIFGDEQEPFGKIRDAMIALASGLTGIGIARATDFGHIIGSVHVFDDKVDGSSSFSILLVIIYFILGFFAMYFSRKLALNPALADAKNAMDRIQITKDVSAVAIKITERLSQSLLLGRDFIDEVDSLEPDEEARLRKELYADDVTQFLDECDKDAKTGVLTQPQNISMAAQLQYYRVYFEENGTDARTVQEKKALDWILRALSRDPTNPDFQIKLACILSMQDRNDEAIAILERLERDEEAPQYVQQWLGYYLLQAPDREADAIKHSLSFDAKFPGGSGAVFNAACAYAQLYEKELQSKGTTTLATSNSRIEALRLLRVAIRIDPDNRKLGLKYTSQDGSFASLSNDNEFKELTISPDTKS